jgi:hypothetical protein
MREPDPARRAASGATDLTRISPRKNSYGHVASQHRQASLHRYVGGISRRQPLRPKPRLSTGPVVGAYDVREWLLVLTGGCWLTADGHEPLLLATGDFVLMRVRRASRSPATSHAKSFRSTRKRV